MRQDGGASTSKMHLDLFKPNEALIDSPSKTTEPQAENQLNEDDGTYQKYESPKFFIGSGSPVRKTSKRTDGILDDDEEEKQHSGGMSLQETSGQNKYKHKKSTEAEQHFSFQRTQLLTDQSHDNDEEDIDFITGALAETDNQNLTGDMMSDQDYNENFAEEFKLK